MVLKMGQWEEEFVQPYDNYDVIADVLLYIVYGDDLGDDNTNKAEKKRKDPKASLCMELVMMIILII